MCSCVCECVCRFVLLYVRGIQVHRFWFLGSGGAVRGRRGSYCGCRSRGCLDRAGRSDTLLRMCWESASGGALTPRPAVAGRRAWLCSSNNCRSSTKPVMCLPSFHPHSKPKGIDAIIPILQMRKSERLNEAPRTVSLAAGNIIQVPLNPSLNT